MSSIRNGKARVVADTAQGHLLASVELPAPPERVFRALASKEVTDWWVRAGVFDTRDWAGDVCVGGRWRASGVARGQPYALEGEFVEIDPPRRLAHTWLPPPAQTEQPRPDYQTRCSERCRVHPARPAGTKEKGTA